MSVTLEVHGPVALITIDRPQALNALMAQTGFTHIELVPNPMPLHAQLLVGRKSRGFPVDSTDSPVKASI